ncbi:hypothetical protein CEQ21_07635 (plasmid) [Niallia circulans]|uniref:Uncharacterized protein n=1 Tax=Niallia circulans TaxID=1397 RepID=A0A553SQG5_NIACI|nr:hypothetical protein [Niallia circulans]TRZ39231.1 hypothetical protein CEQ21_07635 [Niallia circulans]
MINQNNDNFNWKKLYFSKNSFLNTILCLAFCFAILSSIFLNDFSWSGFFTLLFILVILLLISPINDYGHRMLVGKEDVDLSVYPTSTYDIKKLKEELERLEKLNLGKGYRRVMNINEKLVYSFSIGVFGVGLFIVALKLINGEFTDLVNWLSITAFGMALYPMMETAAKNRLAGKINEIHSRLNDIKDRQNENKLNKILHTLEKLKNQN